MAYTRRHQSGLESGDVDEFDSVTDASIGTSNTYTGTYCLSKTVLSQNVDIRQGFADTRQIRGGFFMRYGIGGSVFNGKFLFRVYSGGVGGTRHVDVRATANSTDMNLYVFGTKRGEYYYITPDTYFHFGFDVKINGTVGWAYIYINGSLVMSFDGNTGSIDINTIQIGPNSSASADSIDPFYMDDFYIDDSTGESSPTAPPIKRFYSLTPNGDGNYSQWTPIPTGSHYQKVDERPPNDNTDYLEAVTGSLYDSFDMTTFTLDTNENIIAMIPYVFAKRGSTSEQIALGTRSSGTDSVGDDKDLSVAYDYVWDRHVTGSLGFEWNQSYLDSVEIIIKSAGTY